MRAHVIEDYRKSGFKIVEGLFTIDCLYNADRIFITNALMGQIIVKSID